MYYIRCIAQDEATLSPADNDSWLNVDPVQLEAFLSEQWGNVKNKKHGQESMSLREKVQSFFNQTSDIDGVQFLEYVTDTLILTNDVPFSTISMLLSFSLAIIPRKLI